MKFYALLTVDLKNADVSERRIFDVILIKEKWTKISDLTTTWKASFKDGISKEEATELIEGDLKKAKKESEISEITYAFQLAEHEVATGKL